MNGVVNMGKTPIWVNPLLRLRHLPYNEGKYWGFEVDPGMAQLAALPEEFSVHFKIDKVNGKGPARYVLVITAEWPAEEKE